MDIADARLLTKSLIGRLERRGEYFDLPGGRLSAHEVAALRRLTGDANGSDAELGPTIAGSPSGSPMETASAAIIASEPVLEVNKAAFNRTGPSPDELRICIDFGTAMSKAWATGRSVGETLPLMIGKPAGMGQSLAVPSSIFIADNGRLYFGNEAEIQHRANNRPGRARFDNLKRMLSEEQVGCDLYAVPPRDGVDPTLSGLTQGDLLVLYLAWVTDLSERALSDALAETNGRLVYNEEALRAVPRRFAIPCFEDAEDDRGRGSERALWAQGVMRDALSRAQIVADSLSGAWSGLRASQVAGLTKQVHGLDIGPLSMLLVERGDIREPIAAGASRFDSLLITGDEPFPRPVRRILMVVDAGAGTTDFAMFQVIMPAGGTEPRYALLRRSVRMTRVAGNEIDSILRPLILEQCGASSPSRSDEDLAYIRADLDSQLRDLKQLLFEKKSIEIDLKLNARGRMELDALLSNPAIAERGNRLLKIRNDLIGDVFGPKQLEELRAVTAGRSFPIYVLLTGGSSSLPIIRALASGELQHHGVRFRFSAVENLPDWIDRLPREIAELVARSYPQCAVAIGGSVPELPSELADFDEPITPPLPGERRLERVQMQGL